MCCVGAPEAEGVLDLAGGLAGVPAVEAQRLGGGRNSRVHRVELEDGRRVVLKQTFRHPADGRDRAGTEAAALRFLHARGIQEVPEVLALDAPRGALLLSYLPGLPALLGTCGDDMDQALDFLARLAALARWPGARALPDASEAFFSVPDVLANVQRRLARFDTAEGDLEAFLETHLRPAFHRLALRIPARLGGMFERVLPQEERTLSPSDFGLHNALRAPDGRLAYVDFEYFGWDDPAKTLCDVLLHPGMALGEDLKARFRAGFLHRFGDRAGLEARVDALLPLYGLKWTLILLNELLPDAWARRRFAEGGEAAAARARQMEKARRFWIEVAGRLG